MKSKLLFNKIVFIFVIIIELVLCIFICVKTNNQKYNEWVEIEAKITDLFVTGTYKSIRSNESTVISIMVNYQNNDRLMRFVDYNIKLHEGDTITIRYNPENQRDIIHLPYENHLIFIKRLKIIIFFCVVVFITVCVYIKKQEDEKLRISSERWFEEYINKKH